MLLYAYYLVTFLCIVLGLSLLNVNGRFFFEKGDYNRNYRNMGAQLYKIQTIKNN